MQHIKTTTEGVQTTTDSLLGTTVDAITLSDTDVTTKSLNTQEIIGERIILQSFNDDFFDGSIDLLGEALNSNERIGGFVRLAKQSPTAIYDQGIEIGAYEFDNRSGRRPGSSGSIFVGRDYVFSNKDFVLANRNNQPLVEGGVVITSPDAQEWRLRVDNNGNLTTLRNSRISRDYKVLESTVNVSDGTITTVSTIEIEVALRSIPVGEVTVSIDRRFLSTRTPSGTIEIEPTDPLYDVIVGQSSNVTFDSTNWNIPQSITLPMSSTFNIDAVASRLPEPTFPGQYVFYTGGYVTATSTSTEDSYYDISSAILVYFTANF